MSRTFHPLKKNYATSFKTLYNPIRIAMNTMTPLESRGNPDLSGQISFAEHLRALVFFHLEEHTSAQHLLQVLEEDEFARSEIAPKGGNELPRRKQRGSSLKTIPFLI